MYNKKKVLILLGIFLLTASLLTIVSAPDTGGWDDYSADTGPGYPDSATQDKVGVNKFITELTSVLIPVLKPLFGETSPNHLLEELIFALVLVAIIYAALDRTPVIRNNNFALWTLTIGISIISVRFIVTKNLVEQLLIPQGVLGISLLILIPLAIYFWFVEFVLTSQTMRKIAWSIFAAVYGFMWYREYVNLSGGSYSITNQFAYLYLIAAGVAIFLLLADGTIQKAFKKMKFESQMKEMDYVRYSKLKKERDDIHEAYLDSVKDGDDKKITALEKRLENIDKAMQKLA